MLGNSSSQLINRSKEKNQILILIGTKKSLDNVRRWCLIKIFLINAE